MAKNYEKLANEILELVGTSANITHFTHCATRLRFNVKDKSLIQKEKLKNWTVLWAPTGLAISFRLSSEDR